MKRSRRKLLTKSFYLSTALIVLFGFLSIKTSKKNNEIRNYPIMAEYIHTIKNKIGVRRLLSNSYTLRSIADYDIGLIIEAQSLVAKEDSLISKITEIWDSEKYKKYQSDINKNNSTEQGYAFLSSLFLVYSLSSGAYLKYESDKKKKRT